MDNLKETMNKIKKREKLKEYLVEISKKDSMLDIFILISLH